MFKSLAPFVKDTAVAHESLALEGLNDTETCAEPNNGPKGDDALPMRFGAAQIKMKAPDGCPHIVEKMQDATVVGYDVYIFGEIYYGRSESRPVQHLVQLLDHAGEGQLFTFYIASPGGHLSAMGAIVSAMKRTRARIVTVAIGAVMSAATVVWWAGHERVIYPGAVFMFHFSSHGDYGQTRGVSQRAAALIQYVQENLLDPMVKDHLITDLEMSTILAGEDVLIPAQIMRERVASAPVQQIAQAEATADAQPAESEEPPAEEYVPEETSGDTGTDDGSDMENTEETGYEE